MWAVTIVLAMLAPGLVAFGYYWGFQRGRIRGRAEAHVAPFEAKRVTNPRGYSLVTPSNRGDLVTPSNRGDLVFFDFGSDNSMEGEVE
jgi:hypothetical protein